MWDYSEKVMDLFHNPHNMGAIATEDCQDTERVAIGEVGSIACGDALRLHLRVDTKSDRIVEARFQTFGCASAIASSSILTDLIVGLTLDEALKVTNRDIAQSLDGLPQEKMHCSVMGQEALESAISNYRGVPVRPDEEDDETPLLCSCFGVSRGKIERIIRENHLTSAEDVTNYLKAGGGCGSCLADIDDLVDEVNGKIAASSYETEVEDTLEPESVLPRLTNLEKITRIQRVIEDEVRPLLALDGGDLELHDIQGDRVQVVLKGSCHNCASVMTTLKLAIEKTLRDRVSPDLIVEAL